MKDIGEPLPQGTWLEQVKKRCDAGKCDQLTMNLVTEIQRLEAALDLAHFAAMPYK